jgi:undecaprenyl-diphosphatase
MDWFESLILGAVQGVTEFLPISSDGHLAITQQAFARLKGSTSGQEENFFFDVMLHLGTLTAILIYYRAVIRTAARGLLGLAVVPPAYRRGAVVRTGLLAAVATAPLVPLALFFLKYIKQAFTSTTATGAGFLVTAAVLLLTARLQSRGEGGKGPSDTTWLDALLIGLAQMFAPLPGVSRSGLTVAAALGLGLSRAWAVGFSLLIAIPAILGAAVKELKDVDPATLGADRIAQTVAATALAGVVGYGAIIWLVKIVRSGRMWYFSVYLVVLGLAVLAASASSPSSSSSSRGVSPDVRSEGAADGASRRGGSGPAAGRGEGLGHGPVAGPLVAGSLAGPVGAGAISGNGPGASGLVLGRPVAGRW